MSPPPQIIPPFPYADLLSKGPYGDWRDDLAQDGYVVVKAAIPRNRALQLRDAAFSWLESFGRGFQRDDPSTYGQEFLPMHNGRGMYSSYGFQQEQWVWDVRLEPGVKAAFAKLWGTDKLVSSMDGGAIMLPGQTPPAELDANWAHIDCSPSRVGFFAAQGIINLQDNGPDDGGLVVMKGSSRLMKEFFDEHGRPPVPPVGEKIDWHMFTEEDKQWFFARGCEWLKVEAEAGDLILWSSGTIHQNTPPKGSRDRTVTYVCMGPAHIVTPADQEVRTAAFKSRVWGTSHAPYHGSFAVIRHPIRPETGKADEETAKCKSPVVVTDEVLRLAGQLAY
ncbi:hypothetical protein BCR35DRAFT_346935 [Leucosporidium creatinivorum]|uniref:Phytanoyl-CoA dioxygenase n=1 Tax=Leucosporidium creatinivorum TaxID=106004 RepID=A0A1Y2DM72_9BASI|nr:hypothetical protein BCR35DRAFT_346935 [Leucosporidium creatinivorum]